GAPMARGHFALRSQAGLTLVEVMVAMTLLLVGLVGTIKLIDVGSASQGDARAREGATNLARELLEDAHDTASKQIGASGWFTPVMQNLDPGATHSLSFCATGATCAQPVPTLCPMTRPLSTPACTPPITITDSTQTDQTFPAAANGAADMKFSVNGVEVTSGVTNNNDGTWDFD